MTNEKKIDSVVVLQMECLTRELTGNFAVNVIAPARTESSTPFSYRLAKKSDGTLILQGAYQWSEGWSNCGHEWRDIPTVDIDESNAGAVR